MPSNSKVLILALALAGCVGGHGGRDAPRIALPPGAALGSDDARDAPPPPPERPMAAQRAKPLLPQDAPPEVAQGAGPRGTSGEVHEDAVGYATLMRSAPEGAWSTVTVGVAHPLLPSGTLVELTALGTGRTIVAMVVAREDGGVVALSPGAAQALGVGDNAAVRVRSIAASPQDRNALRAGQPAGQRLDAPPALLAALRRKLPQQRGGMPRNTSHAYGARTPMVASRQPRPALEPATTPTREPAARSGYIVQVAALSSAERAAALARQLGGRVERSGALYRVQLGPYATPAEAQRARDGAARRGYGDARISRTD